jgi:hypothetical protein
LTTPEGRVKHKVKQVLKPFIEDGSLWGDWPVPSGFGKSGLDYHGCSQGRYFAIETKVPGKQPTERQSRCIAQIERAGGKVFVIDGSDNNQYLELKCWLAAPPRSMK